MASIRIINDRVRIDFKEKVFRTTDVYTLNKMRKNTTDEDEISVIDARICNINYLIP